MQAAVVLPEPLVVIECSDGRNRLVGPPVPDDQLAAGPAELGEVKAQGVALHALRYQPAELVGGELEIGQR
jgi:hypothetical protein